MNDVSRWPIDYDALRKGTTISRERLERITGKQAGTKDYQLKLLAIQSQIERELNQRGHAWTIKIQKDEIRVLTDAEASTYNHALQVQARCAMEKRYALNAAVDVSALGEDQRKQHDRTMEVDGKYLLALQHVRRSLRLAGHARRTPGKLPSA